MNFIGAGGGVHTNAIFIVRRVHLDVLLGQGTYDLEGYADQAHMDSRTPFWGAMASFASPPPPTNTASQNIALIYATEIQKPFFVEGGATLITP